MTRRQTVLGAVGMIVAFTQVPEAQSGFPGKWKAVGLTSGILGARIFQQDRTWLVQAFGDCAPAPCDWGPVPFTVVTDAERKSPDRGFATWKREDGSAHVVFRLEARDLTAEVYRLHSDTSPPSGFLRNYFGVVRMAREVQSR